MTTFIRFVVGSDAEHHRGLTGVIAEAAALRDADAFAAEEKSRHEAAYKWLNANLPVPPFSTSNWPDNVVSWFKDDATESIRQIRELVALLSDYGVPVRMLRSKNPGRVVYEDDFQVVVAQYRHL